MNADSRQDLLRRLACIRGHVGGVARMIENGESCDAVMLQLKALHGSLNKVSDLLIQSHLTECLPGLLTQEASPEIDLFLSEFSDLVLNARRR